MLDDRLRRAFVEWLAAEWSRQFHRWFRFDGVVGDSAAEDAVVVAAAAVAAAVDGDGGDWPVHGA